LDNEQHQIGDDLSKFCTEGYVNGWPATCCTAIRTSSPVDKTSRREATNTASLWIGTVLAEKEYAFDLPL
jgi:hypothetical protein